MKMKKMMFLMLTLLVWGAVSMNAQVRVGGTTDPNPNALLDVNKDTITVTGNNTGGLALPRVALTSTTIAAPVGTRFVKGMLVYNTATAGTTPNNVTPGAYYSDGAKWIRVSGSDAPVSGWQLGGNTTADGDFIGAINNKPLVFKINGDTVGYVNKSSVAAWGDKALAKTPGSGGNTAIGGSALAVTTTGTYNTAAGYQSLLNNIDGGFNTAVGQGSLRDNTASGNTAVGARSLYLNTTGDQNVAVGDSALRTNTTASGNTAVGYRALLANNAGEHNTAVGDSASVKNTSGYNNTTVGYAAGAAVTSGKNNTLLGTAAGSNLTTGSNNIAIGDSTTLVSASASNQLNIGNWITGTNGRIRIGKTNPQGAAVLDLNVDNSTAGTGNIGGLALPRIALDTTNVQLNGTTPINGTVVYNTNATMKGGQGAGLYMWTGGKWNNITMAVPVSSITLSPSGTVYILGEGKTITIDATIAPDNASNPALRWTSANTNIATVSSKGKITGVAVGNTTVTATAIDGSGKNKSIAVQVVELIVDTATIYSRVYDIVTLPNGLGTWMLSNNKEQTSTTTGIHNYYTKAQATAACPAPWAVPTAAQWNALIAFANAAEGFDGIFYVGTSAQTLTGYYYTPTDFRYYGMRAIWQVQTNAGTPHLGSYYNGIFRTMSGIASSLAAVRCVKP
ncbi:hypothetical protein FACS189437_07530 [Bacteroidia bacterium]|nr:hypothetical protein FACS189437_07530 [Bacteroidia bacterium]